MQLSDFEGLQVYTPDTVPTWQLMNPDAVQKLDALTVAIGHPGPLQLLSLFRTPEENRQAGGTNTSQHLVGNAVDFVVPAGKGVDEVYSAAEAVGFTGIGLYVRQPANVWSMHVDVRPGGPARWSKVDGVYGPISQAWERLKVLAEHVPGGAAGAGALLILSLTTILLIAIFRRH